MVCGGRVCGSIGPQRGACPHEAATVLVPPIVVAHSSAFGWWPAARMSATVRSRRSLFWRAGCTSLRTATAIPAAVLAAVAAMTFASIAYRLVVLPMVRLPSG